MTLSCFIPMQKNLWTLKRLGESPKEFFLESYILAGNIDLLLPQRKLSLDNQVTDPKLTPVPACDLNPLG